VVFQKHQQHNYTTTAKKFLNQFKRIYQQVLNLTLLFDNPVVSHSLAYSPTAMFYPFSAVL